MTATQPNQAGLTSAEAKRLQDKYGKNELSPQKKERFLKKVFHIICQSVEKVITAVNCKKQWGKTLVFPHTPLAPLNRLTARQRAEW